MIVWIPGERINTINKLKYFIEKGTADFFRLTESSRYLHVGRDDHSDLIGNNMNRERKRLQGWNSKRLLGWRFAQPHQHAKKFSLFLSLSPSSTFSWFSAKQLDYGYAALLNLKRARVYFCPTNKNISQYYKNSSQYFSYNKTDVSTFI